MISVLITSIGCAPASAIARTLLKNSEYNLIGIDIQNECIGNFITHTYVKCPPSLTEDYWNFVRNIINQYDIKFVFVTHANDTLAWSNIKHTLPCKVFLNEPNIVSLMDSKLKTVEWCMNNSIPVPEIVSPSSRPIVFKLETGFGSSNVRILKNSDDKINENLLEQPHIFQRFISGDEYTIDILSDDLGNVINVVPKKRLLVKNGQSFKSIICMDDDLVNFSKHIASMLKSKYVINIQVIREYITNKIYLIEMNPRWATTISLTIESGINMPLMLLSEHFDSSLEPKNNLMMIRDYREYFIEDSKK